MTVSLRTGVVRAVLACGITLAACGAQPAQLTSSPSTGASLPPIAEARPTPPPDQVRSWQRFRQALGLRSDEAWIHTVAADPTSANELDIPLLPSELDQVVARNLVVADLVRPLEQYGRLHPDAFAGAFIEGPVAVIAFNRHLVERQAEVETLLGHDAPVEVRQVRYSLDELTALAAQVAADKETLASAGVHLLRSEPNIGVNKVELIYRGHEGVEPRLIAHFGNPDWLKVSRAGALQWAGGYGRLVVRIIDRSGDPAEASITLVSADPLVTAESLPREVTGAYDLEVKAIAWDVVVSQLVDGVEVSTTVTVRVPDGGVGTATVVVDG